MEASLLAVAKSIYYAMQFAKTTKKFKLLTELKDFFL